MLTLVCKLIHVLTQPGRVNNNLARGAEFYEQAGIGGCCNVDIPIPNDYK